MPTAMTFNSLQQDLRFYLERGWTDASDPEVYQQLPRLINNAERAIATELKIQGFINNVVGFFAVGVDTYSKPDRWREWISLNYGSAKTFNAKTASRAGGGLNTVVLDEPHGYSVGATVVVSGMTDSNYNTGNAGVTVVAVDQLSIQYVTGGPVAPPTSETGLVSVLMEDRQLLLPRSYEYCRRYWSDPRVLGDPLYYADYDYYHFIVVPTPRRPCPFEMNYYQQPPLLDNVQQTNWLTDLQPNLLLYRTLIEASPFLKNEERLQTWQGMFSELAQAITGQDIDKINDRTTERSKP